MPSQLQIDESTTVRELVGRYPQARPIFEKFEIDYCCGGGRTLRDAVADRDVNLTVLIDALANATKTTSPTAQKSERDWYAAPLSELVEHIVNTHHSYVKTALPRLRLLIPKVLAAHGKNHGEVLEQVQGNFNALDAELSSHLMKEEQMLFPYIVALDTHSREATARPRAPFGSLQNPVRQMEHEHESAGNALAGLRQVTHDYALPNDACPTFQAMYEELQRFDADLHQHIHLENNILFPRAIELESACS